MSITNLSGYNNRDCVLFHKGDTMPIKISATLATRGWVGGAFVRWGDDGTGEPGVDLANGTYCGFLPFGSNESGDQYTAITQTNVRSRTVSLYFGGNFLATTSYERYTYASRHGGGPLVPLVYSVQQFLYVSENGLLTNQDESDPAVNAGGLFPDGTPITVRFLYFGICALPPSTLSNGYAYVQTNVGI